MKEFVFSGYRVKKQTYQYDVKLTSEQLAEHFHFTEAEEIEAMTEEEMEVFIQDNFDIIVELVDDQDDSVSIYYIDDEDIFEESVDIEIRNRDE